MIRPHPISTLFPYTTLFRSVDAKTGKVRWFFNTIPQDEKDQGWDIAGPTWTGGERNGGGIWETPAIDPALGLLDRKSTRLNSSHQIISYAVFCLKKKKNKDI